MQVEKELVMHDLVVREDVAMLALIMLRSMRRELVAMEEELEIKRQMLVHDRLKFSQVEQRQEDTFEMEAERWDGLS
jgi:hypothetical protein